MKLLEDGSPKMVFKTFEMSIYNITQLRYTSIATNMGNMNYIFTLTPNYHTKLMMRHVNEENVTKLQT